jgi:hypothetical protein
MDATTTQSQQKSFGESSLQSFKQEVEDAKLLLEFAVAQGYAAEDGKKVPDNLVEAIKSAEDTLRNLELGPNKFPTAEQRAIFEKAYRDLASLLAPVTAETLKATSPDPAYSVKWMWIKKPEAIIWSRKLTIITILFVALSVIGDLFLQTQNQFAPPLDEAKTFFEKFLYYVKMLLDITVPFTYGGIGACAFLLRSCHQYIIKRQFNKAYIPEYYNRILLGMISGGSITMFASQIITGQGTTIHLSSAALGFLAGYNTDFLFTTLERVIQAILPKVGVETVRRAGATSTTSVSYSVEDLSLKDLMNQYNNAKTPEDKALYKSLIDKLRDKL